MQTVKTGDVLLFCGNTPTGFMLRTFTSSEWNHSGIAIRFVTDNDRKVISLTEEGELYILETNTGSRKDDILGHQVTGAGFSRLSWVLSKYNRVAVRRLHDIFRTPELATLTLDFANRYRGNRFPSSNLPFIGVWLGISLVNKGVMSPEMFCSELMAHYYAYCIGPQYEKVTGRPFDGTLAALFGNEAPRVEELFIPEHYTSNNTPNASIFSGNEELIHTEPADLIYVILQPFILILFVILIIWMTLPQESSAL
jgi:hypothetical protein